MYQELATILPNYHIGRVVLGSMCVGVVSVFSVLQAEACNTDTTPSHIEPRTTRPMW